MWPNIQTIPTPALWLSRKRDWHPARETGQSGEFLGLDYLDYWPVVTVGQAAAETGQSGEFLGLDYLDYAPTTPPMSGTPATENQLQSQFFGLDLLSYDP